MTKSEKNIEKHAAKLEAVTDRLALGYEPTMDFCRGYIFALLHAGEISLKEKKILDKVFGYANADCRYALEKGKLIDYGDEE